jgi:choice-of-anchor C domain-containing protein
VLRRPAAEWSNTDVSQPTRQLPPPHAEQFRRPRAVVALIFAALLLAGGTPVWAAPAGDAASSTGPPSAALEPPAGPLVPTGGFEPPDVDEVQGYDTYTAADHPALGAWTITAGSVDLIGAGWEDAKQGKQYVDLNGNDGDGTAATLTQTLNTTAGHRYRLEFLLAGNPHGDPPVKHLDVQLGTVRGSFSTDAATGDTLNWQQVSLEADAWSAGTVVTFTSRTEGQRGPLIDAVSLVDVGAAVACGGAGAVALWQILLLSGLGVAWVVAMVAFGAAVLRRRRPAVA